MAQEQLANNIVTKEPNIIPPFVWTDIIAVLSRHFNNVALPCDIYRDPQAVRCCQGDLLYCKSPSVDTFASLLKNRFGILTTFQAGWIPLSTIKENIDSNRPIVIWLSFANGLQPALIVGYSGDTLLTLGPSDISSYISYDRLMEHNNQLGQGFWRGSMMISPNQTINYGERFPLKWSQGSSLIQEALITDKAGRVFASPFICRALFRGGLYPGELVSGQCQFAYGGIMLALSRYELLVGDNSAISWDAKAFRADVPQEDFFPAGMTNNNVLLLCRAVWNGRFHISYVSDNRCWIGDRNGLVGVEDFDIFYVYPNTKTIENDLEKILKHIESDFRHRLSLLSTVEGYSSEGKLIEGFEVKEVKTLIEGVKTQLLDNLDGAELSGLKAYVRKYYPVARKTETYTVKPLQASSNGTVREAVIGRWNGFVPIQTDQTELIVITRPSAFGIFNDLQKFLAKLQANQRAVNIRVISLPDEASVELKTESGGVRTTSTNSEFRNLFRGLYIYTVNKNGYKVVQRELNLIDEDGSVLRCKLYKLTDKDGPYPCSLDR